MLRRGLGRRLLASPCERAGKEQRARQRYRGVLTCYYKRRWAKAKRARCALLLRSLMAETGGGEVKGWDGWRMQMQMQARLAWLRWVSGQLQGRTADVQRWVEAGADAQQHKLATMDRLEVARQQR